MNIQIRRIGPDGLDLEETFPIDFIGLVQKDIVRFVEPFGEFEPHMFLGNR